MKVVILAGGFGTRLAEETTLRPKPMVEIGGRPILWHIMKIYAAHGLTDFVICLGYRGDVIKDYFASYFLHASSVRFDLAANRMETLGGEVEPWTVTLVDTGDDTMTGGRLRRAAPYLDDEPFCFTYGDCVADLDVARLVAFHRETGAGVTLTAVQPPGRFGVVEVHEDRVETFMEKPRGDGGWINGGFFVVEPDVIGGIAGDATVWEREPLQNLAREGRLGAYRHEGFWHPMDTVRDKMMLEKQWASGDPPWRVW